MVRMGGGYLGRGGGGCDGNVWDGIGWDGDRRDDVFSVVYCLQ